MKSIIKQIYNPSYGWNIKTQQFIYHRNLNIRAMINFSFKNGCIENAKKFKKGESLDKKCRSASSFIKIKDYYISVIL